MDNPVSWLLLVLAMATFLTWFANKAMADYEARRREAEEYWENFHR